MNPPKSKVVIIGAGNRANKYLEYAIRNPQRCEIVGVVEPLEIRRTAIAHKFALREESCFSSYYDFFDAKVEADAVFICTPEDKHFEPCMMAIEAGYNVLLEKPIAQTKEECEQIMMAARRCKVVVGVCHVLRYHPYFQKIKQIVESRELGEIISINHYADINLDRMMHSYVRGCWNQSRRTNPMLVAKCCHDIDFLLWVCEARASKVSSFGSLRWFCSDNAPQGCAARCVDCSIERECPYSAVDLYQNRKEWIANFDVPQGKSLDEVIDMELRQGPYGRCVYHCDNDVVDNQVVNIELENRVVISFTVNAFTRNDSRKTHIKLSGGEIDGDEKTLRVRRFRGGEEQFFDFSHLEHQPFHAGADLNIVEEFLRVIESDNSEQICSNVEGAIGSHIVCFEAERSRLIGQVIEV